MSELDKLLKTIRIAIIIWITSSLIITILFITGIIVLNINTNDENMNKRTNLIQEQIPNLTSDFD